MMVSGHHFEKVSPFPHKRNNIFLPPHRVGYRNTSRKENIAAIRGCAHSL